MIQKSKLTNNNTEEKATCPKCRHLWKTKSKLYKVTCPSCGSKVTNTNFIPENECST